MGSAKIGSVPEAAEIQTVLQFPNVRLHLYNQLLESGAGCVAVMFRSAYELGLVPDGSLDDCVQPANCGMCGSLWAARQIIERLFDGQRTRSDLQQLVDTVWSSVKNDVETYKLETKLLHDRQPGLLPPATECSRMAPVVFDILLQHLRRYL